MIVVGDVFINNKTGSAATVEFLGYVTGVFFIRLSNGFLFGLSYVQLTNRWTKQ